MWIALVKSQIKSRGFSMRLQVSYAFFKLKNATGKEQFCTYNWYTLNSVPSWALTAH